MQSWNDIIQVAMMGTDKKSVDILQFPEGLKKQASVIAQHASLEREERFLQTAALVCQAKRAGFIPSIVEVAHPLQAPEEEQPYASQAAHSLLKQIMEEDELPLLLAWLQECQKAACIINPEWLPRLFEKGLQHRKLQPLLAACAGKRGQWICRYNEAWNYTHSAEPEEVWLHGGWEQRKDVFQELRKTDRVKAMDLLQKTWKEEDANTRFSLLELMEKTCAQDDLPFLESLEQDKSKKVKEKSLEIQQKIPESTPVAFYVAFMKKALKIHKETSMLGMLSKTTLRFQLPADQEKELVKMGIQKLSEDKSMSDEEYICYQLFQHLPPVRWKEITGLDAASFIQVLQKDEFGKKMIPALVLSIKRFRDLNWAQQFLQTSTTFYIDLIPFLEETQRDAYSLKYFEKFQDNIAAYALMYGKEWSLEFCEKLFKFTAGKPYQYPKSFYSEHIGLIPPGIAGHLAKFAPQEQYLGNLWKGISEHIYMLLKLKYQTKQSFNA